MSDLQTPAQLAEKHGYVLKHVSKEDVGAYHPDHAVAAVLNGWTKHERETGAAFLMSAEDYLAALEAARKGRAYEPVNCRLKAEA